VLCRRPPPQVFRPRYFSQVGYPVAGSTGHPAPTGRSPCIALGRWLPESQTGRETPRPYLAAPPAGQKAQELTSSQFAILLRKGAARRRTHAVQHVCDSAVTARASPHPQTDVALRTHVARPAQAPRATNKRDSVSGLTLPPTARAPTASLAGLGSPQSAHSQALA